jgi:hypothetical protein
MAIGLRPFVSSRFQKNSENAQHAAGHQRISLSTIEIEHDAESSIEDWLFSIVVDSNT